MGVWVVWVVCSQHGRVERGEKREEGGGERGQTRSLSRVEVQGAGYMVRGDS